MMKKRKLTYEELEARLRQTEESLRAIRSGEIDMIIGEESPLVVRAKAVEEALRESEENFRAVVENANDGIIISGADGSHLYANKRACEITGYSIEELLRIGMRGLAHPDEIPILSERLRRRIAGEVVTQQYETRFVHKDGRTVSIEISGARTFWKGQVAVLVIIRDITKRKQMEESLLLEKQRFQILCDKSPFGVVIINPDGKFEYINNKFRELFGYDLAEIPDGKTWFRKAYPDPVYRNEVIKKWIDDLKSTKDGEVRPRVFTVRCKDGSEKIINFISVLFETGQNLMFCEDFTELKRAEESLRESEEKYRTLIERANDGIVIIQDGIMKFANPRIAEMWGGTPEEIIGTPFTKYIHPDEVSKLEDRYRRRMAGEEVTPIYETILQRRDGSPFYAEINAGLISYEGRPADLVIVRDITERKRMEQEMVSLQAQLQQAQKMEAIGRLAGGIAHDFNNLLSVIKGTCQLSLLDLREGDPLYGDLKEIERASDRAADLTRQLLAFSRKQIMEMRVLDLNDVIKGFEKMLKRIIGEDIELVTYLSEGLGRVKVDQAQMEQAIINIVVNARDAMPKGGRLTIETANVELDEEYARRHIGVKPGSYVMVAISDTGVGMTPEVKDRIFEPFFTTKEMGMGTGLGLSTVYGIVKQSGGNIWVYSEPGRGATFKIYLPRVDEPVAELREEVIQETPQGSETVLEVEDEETVRKLAVRLLKKQGYRVLEAPDGGQAFILCERYTEPIHLILSDVVMPGISGRELVERLQRIHPEAKAIYMSGYTDNVILHHGILEEGLNFIQKPFTLESLARKVREVLDKK